MKDKNYHKSAYFKSDFVADTKMKEGTDFSLAGLSRDTDRLPSEKPGWQPDTLLLAHGPHHQLKVFQEGLEIFLVLDLLLKDRQNHVVGDRIRIPGDVH